MHRLNKYEYKYNAAVLLLMQYVRLQSLYRKCTQPVELPK